jgi:tetratricopeptide (TPR) repeat protein
MSILILIMNVLFLIVACLLRPPCECVAFSATPTAAAAAVAAAYRKEQNLAQASIEFRRASELDPSNIDARYGLGQVLSEMGYIDDAVDVFRELIAKDEDDVVTDGKPSRYKISLANILLDGRGDKKEALLIPKRQICYGVVGWDRFRFHGKS